MNTSLYHILSHNWWLVLLRGLAAILFGALAFLWPGLTLVMLVILFGTYAIVDGVIALAQAFRSPPPAPRAWLVITGLVGLAAGIATFAYPGLTAVMLLVFTAVWFIVRGVTEMVGAIQLRREIKNEWLLILSGLISVLFGIIMLASPGAGALALVWMIATTAVVSGGLLIGLSLQLRRRSGVRDDPSGIPHPA
jgi:uncharacterized membrane protein HdeD (DUF308 family)